MIWGELSILRKGSKPEAAIVKRAVKDTPLKRIIRGIIPSSTPLISLEDPWIYAWLRNRIKYRGAP